jgi:hypothetical protein
MCQHYIECYALDQYNIDGYKEALSWLEKQGKQKSADMVEPKFKVGDWVICCDYEPVQIISIRANAYYEMSNGDSRPFYMVDNNPNIRPWTIQDANDGDVLTYRDGKWIFIYKEKIDNNSFYYHALYSTIHQDLTINDAGFPLLDDTTTPATKEQRDLLFSKMKEAGYEWNAKKKELKKEKD